MDESSLKASEREVMGKQAAKHHRIAGDVPAVLYGTGMSPLHLAINAKELLLLLQKHGRNTIVNLSLADKKKNYKSFIYDIQHHPLSGDIIHVDLKQISLTERIHVSVPVVLHGTAYGVKNEGGIIEHMLHTIDILSLPGNIPSEIGIDMTDLKVGDTVHVRDILGGDFEVEADTDAAIVHVVLPKAAKAADEEEAEIVIGAAEPKVVGQED